MRAERRPKHASVEVRLYVLLTVGLASLLAWWTLASWGLPDWKGVGFFWLVNALVLLVGRVEIPVTRLALATAQQQQRGMMLSPTFVVLLTAAYATSPSTALIVAFIPPVLELLKRDERSLIRVVFNSAQEGIYVGAASIAFSSIRSLDGVAAAFMGAAAAAVVAQTLNTVLVAGVVGLSNGITWREMIRRMTWIVPHSFGFGFVALMIATLYRQSGPIAAVFLLMPLLAMRVVRQAKLGLDKQREDTLTDFVRAVESKDPYTFRHSERVAAITIELHKELGAKSSDLEERWYAALLHDVGKVAVPAGILTKAAALTESEYEAIKTHPVVGAEVVSEIDLLRDLAPEIRAHHERIDGLGYPDALIGEEIPLAGRVLAVADAFDALTSDRPYRAAMSDDEAVRELERWAGRQHDAAVLDALRVVLARRVTFMRRPRIHSVEQENTRATGQ